MKIKLKENFTTINNFWDKSMCTYIFWVLQFLVCFIRDLIFIFIYSFNFLSGHRMNVWTVIAVHKMKRTHKMLRWFFWDAFAIICVWICSPNEWSATVAYQHYHGILSHCKKCTFDVVIESFNFLLSVNSATVSSIHFCLLHVSCFSISFLHYTN